MDFDSPDVMKDFPGLYASDIHKTKCNESDYSDEAEKSLKKEVVIGKRKDKKDKKDKELGYAALEGESSAEESESRSPSKCKKPKSFKFSAKLKDKREKSRDKELVDKKDKEKKTEKKVEKEKIKPEKREKKLKQEDYSDIAEVLPIFGVPLQLAIERCCCHDGINLPLPVRACVDYVESNGLAFEGVYKIGAPKSKVVHIRKLYNQREDVDLSEYDVPTVTSVLKMFLRDMGESIFTAELLVRFEEAGAILNGTVREKHLKILIGNLPQRYKLLMSWIIVHLHNVSLNEKYNKMNVQNLSMAMCSTLQTSHRLLTALLCHCPALFPNVVIEPYVYPLTSSSQLPGDPNLMEVELHKQESLLSQIHAEMNLGFILKQREELLWEVQRIITQLKRKLKISHKDKELMAERVVAEIQNDEVLEIADTNMGASPNPKIYIEDSEQSTEPVNQLKNDSDSHSIVEEFVQKGPLSDSASNIVVKGVNPINVNQITNVENASLQETLSVLKLKNMSLRALRDSLIRRITSEKAEICELKSQLAVIHPSIVPLIYNETLSTTLSHVMNLLQKENQILQIKKINLVRNIMEQEEACIDLKAKLDIFLKH